MIFCASPDVTNMWKYCDMECCPWHKKRPQHLTKEGEDDKNNETSLKWLTVAMPLLETSKRQERDNTRVRLV